MPNNKIILGLVGEIASGKDTVAKYLKEKHGFQTIKFSTPIRKILDALNLPQSRENMVWVGINVRNRFGENIFGNVIAKECENSTANLIVLPNVRFKPDIAYLKQMNNFYLIHISSEPQIRYQRLIHRNQNSDDQTKTWEEFINDGELPTEITIREVAKIAKHTIKNNGTLDQLHQQIDQLMDKIKK